MSEIGTLKELLMRVQKEKTRAIGKASMFLEMIIMKYRWQRPFY
jgi:hypothetical protein